jgi:NADH-quinone oxidoreductase subunit M
VFFEVVLLPMYFMIGIWGDRGIRDVPLFGWKMEMRLYASLKFFVFTLFGSAFMLL